MTLPASGAISLNNVNVELGFSGTASINMGSAAVRGLFGVASGAITMANGYGKANEFILTISSNTIEANLSTLATANGWNGSTKLICNINAGVYVYGDTAIGTASTKPPGLLIAGTFANGVIINNSGYIIGKGGAGNAVASNQQGGSAINITSGSTITINNLSGAYIAGGGGGGFGAYGNGGGGAGGGGGGTYLGVPAVGGTPGNYGGNGLSAGGASGGAGGGQGGGGGGVSSSNWPNDLANGGAGGRILAGNLGGAGGSPNGSPGGGANNVGLGTYGVGSYPAGAGGGGWAAYGGGLPYGASGNGTGFAAGAAILGSYTQGTWAGTVWGAS
jgi:hypothetical protein